MARSTAAEVALRVNTIYGLLCDGKSRGEIQQYAAENWTLSIRQTDELLARARAALEKDCELSRPAFLAECLGGIRSIRQKAEAGNNHGVALACIRLQAELTGLAKQS